MGGGVGGLANQCKMLQPVCKACTVSRFVEKLTISFPIPMPGIHLANALSYTSSTNWI